MSEVLAQLEKKGGGGFSEHDEIVFKGRLMGGSFLVAGYINGAASTGVAGTFKTGNHLAYNYTNSYFTAKAVTDGYFEVDGTLSYYAANTNLLYLKYDAANDHYALWRASDN